MGCVDIGYAADGQVTGKTDRKSKDCRSVAEWRAVSAASGTRKWTCELEGLQCFPPPPDSVYLACQPLHSILQHTNTHAYFIHTHTHTHTHIYDTTFTNRRMHLPNQIIIRCQWWAASFWNISQNSFIKECLVVCEANL